MFTKIRTAIVSAMVGIGVLAAVPATAQAHQVQVGGGNAQFGIWFGTGGHSHWRGHRRGHGHWNNHRPQRHGCNTRRALNKAHRMGVRHARVKQVNHRFIKVRGRSHGHRVRIIFARAPGCPVIGY